MVRVLLINQFFWPDLAATSQLLTDVARHLAELGHEVTVICAQGAYAGDDQTEAPPVRIIRVPALPFAHHTIGRLSSYASFYAGALWYALRVPKPAVVVTLTTPPLLSLVGRAVQACRGSRHVIWEMDLYPEVAIDVGVLRARSVVARVSGALADNARRHSDRVIALGECMRRRLVSRGLPETSISVAENWADGTLIHPVERVSRSGALTIIYPGNLGLAHDTETIAHAMRELGSEPAIRFLFVGGGARAAELERFCRSSGVRNASFLPYCGRKRLNELMSESDVGLVTQSEACVGSLVPSKVYGLMAAGLPVLFIGPKSTTPAMAVQRFGCGWQVDCGDTGSLLRLLRSLAADREPARAAGARARSAFLTHYDSPVAVRRIAKMLGLDQPGREAA